MDHLELFFGDASEAAARVYARLPRDELPAGLRLEGELIGPECRFAQTLSARIPFRDLGRGESLLAEAIVPDPCFWTPELPMLYRARFRGQSPFAESAEQKGTVPLGAGERWFGIRRLGTMGRSLVLDTHRWVPRGVCLEQITGNDLPVAREAGAALVGPPPNEDICLEASRQGMPLIVEVRHVGSLLDQVRRLGQWPAVFILAFRPDAPIDAVIRAAARNVLFAAMIGNIDSIPPWAQALLVDANPASASSLGDINLPVLVHRRLSSAIDIPTARAACDRLQYDMAPHGDFAGYLL